MSMRTLMLAAAAGLALSANAAVPALAQDAAAVKPAVIAFVDVPRVMRDSSAAKSARSQLEKQGQTYEAEIKAQEDKLRAEEQDLQKQRAALTQDAFAQRARDFQAKVEKAREQFDRRRAQLAFGQDDAARQMQPVLQKIVADIATQIGATIVMDSSRVLVSATDLNITDKVLERLNKDLPSVKVSFNAPQTASQGAKPAAQPAASQASKPAAAPAPAPAPALAPAPGGINLNP